MASAFTKSYRPPRSHTMSKRQTMHRYVQATLGSGDIWAAVELPAGEDECEWIAMNCVDFYNEVSLLYGTIIDFCTRESCPVMSAGRKFEYLWADGVKVKSPIKVPAPDYVDYLMEWIDGQLSNASLFPVTPGDPFPPKFRSRVKVIFKRMFRVYAHIYHSHFREVVALAAEAHLNSCFKHFAAFVLTFRLVDAKDLTPLRELIQTMLGSECLQKGSGPLTDRTAPGALPVQEAGKAAGPSAAGRSPADDQPQSAAAPPRCPNSADSVGRTDSGVHDVDDGGDSSKPTEAQEAPRGEPASTWPVAGNEHKSPTTPPHAADGAGHAVGKGVGQTRPAERVKPEASAGPAVPRTTSLQSDGAATVHGAKEPGARPAHAGESGGNGAAGGARGGGSGGPVERGPQTEGRSCCAVACPCCVVV